MAQQYFKTPRSEPLLAAWIKWTMEFWETMAQMGPRLPGKAASAGDDSLEPATSGDDWLSSLNLWQAFFSLLTEPATVSEVFQGIKAPSEIVLRMAQAGWKGYFHLHRQWLAGWEGSEAPSRSSDFEDLDKDIFKICNELYEKDFRRFLNMPHLRLTVLTQKRLNYATEKFNQFQAAMAEFIYIIYLPVKKSLQAMGEVGGIGSEKKPPEDFKEYYRIWLKILEGHYMTLFQSPEYIRTLVHALHALQDFTVAKDALLAETMEALSLPTRRELDALYREMYLLKKSLKEMAKKMDRPQSTQEQN
ncbi:MAG: poly(R)-hydroxyalkanoic acid synthase subunit PhaE [Thermodesulfobacteriota bacterium]